MLLLLWISVPLLTRVGGGVDHPSHITHTQTRPVKALRNFPKQTLFSRGMLYFWSFFPSIPSKDSINLGRALPVSRDYLPPWGECGGSLQETRRISPHTFTSFAVLIIAGACQIWHTRLSDQGQKSGGTEAVREPASLQRGEISCEPRQQPPVF